MTRVRQHKNDVGQLIAYFEQGSSGQRRLSGLSCEPTYELAVEGDDSGPDFASRCWLDPDNSSGTTWVFHGVKLPR
ncbi:MAG TPA: hypothetical protein VHU90_07140 [Galbitalea sp.]|nr:hypothetical protein [Galbitalea sp.]